MRQKVIAILEARSGEHLGELVAKRGGVPLLAPALEEVPDIDPQAIAALLREWRGNPYALAIFQTGVGTRALFQAAVDLGLEGELLDLLRESVVVVRGPKPVGELTTRGVSIARKASSPFTTQNVLDLIADVDIAGRRVLVQRYGAANRELREALEARHAIVAEISTYRWAPPKNVQPLLDLLDALRHGRVDAVLFTSAVQIQNFHAVAGQAEGSAGVSAALASRDADLAALLNRCVIGSVGPVCSRALVSFGVRPTFEANPPKLGPLLAALETALEAVD